MIVSPACELHAHPLAAKQPPMWVEPEKQRTSEMPPVGCSRSNPIQQLQRRRKSRGVLSFGRSDPLPFLTNRASRESLWENSSATRHRVGFLPPLLVELRRPHN